MSQFVVPLFYEFMDNTILLELVSLSSLKEPIYLLPYKRRSNYVRFAERMRRWDAVSLYYIKAIHNLGKDIFPYLGDPGQKWCAYRSSKEFDAGIGPFSWKYFETEQTSSKKGLETGICALHPPKSMWGHHGKVFLTVHWDWECSGDENGDYAVS